MNASEFLLNGSSSRTQVRWVRRHRSSHKCVSSKAALLILLWSFSVGLVYTSTYQAGNYLAIGSNFVSSIFLPLIYACNAVILCFYPLAGFLADNKYGRFKTITISSQLLLLFLFLGITFGGITMTCWSITTNDVAISSFYFLLLLLCSFPLSILVTACLVMFNANIIQFGMDQLHDSPADHQSLYIHWYIWAYYAAVAIGQVGWISVFGVPNGIIWGSVILGLFFLCCIVLIGIVTLVTRSKQQWFLIDSARINPYKLVHRVTKFARHHKVPIRRSAFTYCEDNVPSGLDLGKDKYGGPFTTEQVEDVKAFYGILKILFALGLTFFLDFAAGPLLAKYARHVTHYSYYGDYYTTPIIQMLLLDYGLLSPVLVLVFIPIHILCIRPFINHYKVRMLKRIGLGIVLMLISVSYTFVTDTVAHSRNVTQICMFDAYDDYSESNLSQNTLTLLPQRCLSALSNVLIYTALYEFICAQSPHSMKGLLIGLSFAIRGLFELLATVIMISFMFMHQSFPSCGMAYFLLNIVVGVVALVVYVHVARKYKLRERDEPCHVRRYVEEYYSKIQQEEHYDYNL